MCLVGRRRWPSEAQEWPIKPGRNVLGYEQYNNHTKRSRKRSIDGECRVFHKAGSRRGRMRATPMTTGGGGNEGSNDQGAEDE